VSYSGGNLFVHLCFHFESEGALLMMYVVVVFNNRARQGVKNSACPSLSEPFHL